jgi:hypothetical protein
MPLGVTGGITVVREDEPRPQATASRIVPEISTNRMPDEVYFVTFCNVFSLPLEDILKLRKSVQDT